MESKSDRYRIPCSRKSSCNISVITKRILLSLLLFLSTKYLRPQEAHTQPTSAELTPLKLCRTNSMLSALVYIAEKKKLFQNHGLDPRITGMNGAKFCQDMLIAKQVEYAITVEAPFTYIAALKTPLKIIAMFQSSPESGIYARADRGIATIHDLKQKRVAYLPGTTSGFFLTRVLKANGLAKSDLQLITLQPPAMPQALISGIVDAISIWEPWASQATQVLGPKAVLLADSSYYRYEGFLITEPSALPAHSKTSLALLKTFIDAENFILHNQEESIAILSKSIPLDEGILRKLWSKYTHKVRLEEGPLRLMEENFGIMRNEDENFREIEMPEFRNLVDESFLKVVAPERVNLP